MSQNVDFLMQFPQWQTLYDSAIEAESHVFTKPRTSLFYSRVTLERAARWLYSNDEFLVYSSKEKQMLGDLIHSRTFKDNLSPGLFPLLQLIIKFGNQAVHGDVKVSSLHASLVFEHLFTFLNWLQRYYGEPPIKGLVFDSSLIPTSAPGSIADESLAELTKLEQQIAEQDEKLAAVEVDNLRLRQQLKVRIEQPHELREPKPAVTIIPQTEALTRQLLIDVMLREAKWDLHGPNVREYAVLGMPNRSQSGFADYVLWGDDGLPLAVIEAKSTTEDARKGKKQAKLYADQLEEQYGRRPLIFYTNGYQTFLWDDTYYPPREVATFYRKDELEWSLQRRREKKPLHTVLPNSQIAGRVYQIEAIRRVSDAFEQARLRALLVMATGTGKTRTVISLVDFLKRAGWVKNVLFLADRRELVKQAYGEFKKHLPTDTFCNLLEEKRDTSARIYFSTYQTMMGFVQQNAVDKMEFGVGHFDLIIIDEAHRSIYNKFGLVFQYFDGLLVGLTATPKAEVDHDTYKFFTLSKNVPTFAYEYEQAIAECNLVPVKPVEIKFKFMHEGINLEDLSTEEREDYEGRIKPLKGNKIAKDALNNWLFNKNTVIQALERLMSQGIKVEGGDILGKTIIFARNQRHAEFIVDVFDEMYPNYRGEFVAAIHNKVDYADVLIKNFKTKRFPRIAVSVDMMDTGIDVPEVVNLVMFRPLFSYSKFWQMIGRGTRLAPNLFGPGENKTHAVLLDLCGNVEYFGEFTENHEEGGGSISITQQLFTQRVELIYELQKRPNESEGLHDLLVTQLTQQLNNLDDHHFEVRPHLPLVLQFRVLENWRPLSQNSKNKILSTLAPIVYDEVHEDQKRFDLIMIRLQHAALGVEKVDRTTSSQKRLQRIAEQLLTKRNIKQVADQVSLLQGILRENFFVQTNADELEKIRRSLRELLSLLERDQQDILYTNYSDTLLDVKEDGELPNSSDLAAYRTYVSQYIKQHQDHLAIQKLRRNKPITDLDVQLFSEMLFQEQIGTQDQFDQVFATTDGSSFGVFVRELLGLERDAAQDAFAEVLRRTTLNANQIHFVNLIIEYLSKNGVLEPGQLMDEPFTSVHQEGVFGVFDDDTVDEIVQIVRFVKEQAKVKKSG